MARSLPGHFDQLTKLCLRDIDLELSKHTWFTFIKLQKITDLELKYCKGADIFLIHIYDKAYFPRLQSFSLVHDLGAQSNRSVHAVNELLRYTRSSLHTLILVLHNAHTLPNVTRIGSNSLRILSFDISHPSDPVANSWGQNSQTPQQLVYSLEDFDVLVASCKNLAQLGIALPNISLEYRKLEKRYPTYTLYLKGLADHLELTTLNITNLPTGYHTELNTGQSGLQDAALGCLAADIFYIFFSDNTLDPGRIMECTFNCSLQVLAFGIRDRDPRSHDSQYFSQPRRRSVADRKKDFTLSCPATSPS